MGSVASSLDSAHLTTEEQAREIILTHRRLFNRLDSLFFACKENVLSVHGELPTFYEKQLLQTALRQIEDVQIDNQVMVTGR